MFNWLKVDAKGYHFAIYGKLSRKYHNFAEAIEPKRTYVARDSSGNPVQKMPTHSCQPAMHAATTPWKAFTNFPGHDLLGHGDYYADGARVPFTISQVTIHEIPVFQHIKQLLKEKKFWGLTRTHNKVIHLTEQQEQTLYTIVKEWNLSYTRSDERKVEKAFNEIIKTWFKACK